MTRIVRCPACGALWKCPDEAAETLRCGECRHTFVLARAETVEVDDDALARVVAARRAPEEKKEAQMAKIAEDLSDFHARETPEPAVPVRAAPPEKKPRKGGALFALLGLVGLAGALTAAPSTFTIRFFGSSLRSGASMKTSAARFPARALPGAT